MIPALTALLSLLTIPVFILTFLGALLWNVVKAVRESRRGRPPR